MNELQFLRQFGAKIREARQKANMSQAELAERIGRTRDAISGYENGSRAMKVTEIPLLARALAVPIAYFFGTTDIDEEAQLVYDLLNDTYRLNAVNFMRWLLTLQRELDAKGIQMTSASGLLSRDEWEKMILGTPPIEEGDIPFDFPPDETGDIDK